MKSIIALTAGLWICGQTLATPGTYEGGGTDRTVNGKPSQYKGTLVVKALKADQVELTETYQGSGGTMTFVSVIEFLKNGMMKVTKNGIKVGCGYYYDLPEGRWANYSLETESGPIHISAFYSKQNATFLRLGDLIDPNGQVHVWTDRYVKTAN